MDNVHYLKFSAPTISFPKSHSSHELDVRDQRGRAFAVISKMARRSGDRIIGVIATSSDGFQSQLTRIRAKHKASLYEAGMYLSLALLSYALIVAFIDVSSWIGIASLTAISVAMGQAFKFMWRMHSAYQADVFNLVENAADLWVITNNRLWLSNGNGRPFVESIDYSQISNIAAMSHEKNIDVAADIGGKSISIYGVGNEDVGLIQRLQSFAKNSTNHNWQLGG